MWIIHAGGLKYVRESAISVVVEEEVTSTLQASWTALHGQTVILTGCAVAKFGKIIKRKVNVMGNEKVDPAVAIVVSERGAGGKLFVGETRLFGDIREGTVTVVAVQDDPTA